MQTRKCYVPEHIENEWINEWMERFGFWMLSRCLKHVDAMHTSGHRASCIVQCTFDFLKQDTIVANGKKNLVDLLKFYGMKTREKSTRIWIFIYALGNNHEMEKWRKKPSHNLLLSSLHFFTDEKKFPASFVVCIPSERNSYKKIIIIYLMCVCVLNAYNSNSSHVWPFNVFSWLKSIQIALFQW